VQIVFLFYLEELCIFVLVLSIGKNTPSLFDSLVETSLIGKYDMPVKGTTPLGATKVISTGQQPMLGFYQITKVLM